MRQNSLIQELQAANDRLERSTLPKAPEAAPEPGTDPAHTPDPHGA